MWRATPGRPPPPCASSTARAMSPCRSTTTAEGGPAPPGSRVPGPGPVSAERRQMIRVVLADDQALVRAGFRALLDAQDDIEVVGEASEGAEAVRLAKHLVPDVVLMDIRMPAVDGLEATRRITADERLAPVRVVI